MIIIYDKLSGNPKDIQVSNSNPLGVTNPERIIESVVKGFGGTKDDYGVFRLHDIDDKETIKKVYTHEFTIVNEEIVFGNVKVIDDQEQKPDPKEVLINKLGEEMIRLKFEVMMLKGGA